MWDALRILSPDAADDPDHVDLRARDSTFGRARDSIFEDVVTDHPIRILSRILKLHSLGLSAFLLTM